MSINNYFLLVARRRFKMTKGGYREGSGRPKQEVIRTPRSTKAYDDEWELTKKFMRILKDGHKSECEEFVRSFN